MSIFWGLKGECGLGVDWQLAGSRAEVMSFVFRRVIVALPPPPNVAEPEPKPVPVSEPRAEDPI
jgi:hypothetical protein